MRVVEPHQFHHSPHRPKGRKAGWILLTAVIVMIVIGTTYLFVKKPATHSLGTNDSQNSSQQTSKSTFSSGPLKQFTGEQFKELYHSVVYPNTQQFTDPPPITGNAIADSRIRQMAEARGYHMTSIPVQAIVKINEPLLNGDDLLQPLAAQGWFDIKAAARKAGHPLTLISAYRSPEYQRNLFTQRLYAHGVTAEEVASGKADAAVETTLSQAAVPGYSRHHTGYTVDMWCDDKSSSFLTSSCYSWISANNYQNAKEYGWIPSYPSGTSDQGPEPEPWEYVWVGRSRLTE